MKILEKSKQHLSKKLPFVIYKKPNEEEIFGFFQKNDTLYATEKFTTSGFVFAPFNTNSPTYIIPEIESDYVKESLENCDLEYSNKIPVIDDELSKCQHINLVEKGIEEIKKSNLKKVVLSRKEELKIEFFNCFESFYRMTQIYKNAFVYLWYHPLEGMWLGASPETLVKLKDNSFLTIALAGTMPYQDTEDVDWGKKEKDEHQFVVDYIFNQIKDSNLLVNDLVVSSSYTSKAANLLHLRADFTGKISNNNIGKLIKILHPTPAICGFPKDQAKQFILENENYQREFYSGFLGEINRNNSSELFVNLRCMKVIDDVVTIFIGGGITKDSVPKKEWEETEAKAQTIKKIL